MLLLFYLFIFSNGLNLVKTSIIQEAKGWRVHNVIIRVEKHDYLKLSLCVFTPFPLSVQVTLTVFVSTPCAMNLNLLTPFSGMLP